MKLSPNKKLLVKKLFALIDDDGDMDTTPYTLLFTRVCKKSWRKDQNRKDYGYGWLHT